MSEGKKESKSFSSLIDRSAEVESQLDGEGALKSFSLLIEKAAAQSATHVYVLVGNHEARISFRLRDGTLFRNGILEKHIAMNILETSFSTLDKYYSTEDYRYYYSKRFVIPIFNGEVSEIHGLVGRITFPPCVKELSLDACPMSNGALFTIGLVTSELVPDLPSLGISREVERRLKETVVSGYGLVLIGAPAPGAAGRAAAALLQEVIRDGGNTGPLVAVLSRP